MKLPPRLPLLPIVVVIATVLTLGIQQPATAQEPSTDQTTVPAEDELPFQPPFAEPPGPYTWLLAQPYGNTVGAYFQRHRTYGASGGIHFGVDLAAPCGTELVAVADGVVFAIDGPFGSPPHNLMIDHPDLGYASMYGHLLEAPSLRPGQIVKQGEVVALVGEPRGDCNSSPHVHLEFRDLNHVQKFNPATLIDIDWNRLALYGGWGSGFMHDLDEPRKWQQLYDQPQARTGGPIVNDFARTWPLDWNLSPNGVAPVSLSPTPTETEAPNPLALETPATALPPNMRQITAGNCCANIYWNDDSTEIRFVDQPTTSNPVGIWGIDITQPAASFHLVTERLGVYSFDKSLVAFPNRAEGLVVVERLADGQQWEVDTGENSVSFTPDGRLLWTNYDREESFRSRQAEVWLSDIDGSNAAILTTLERGGPAAWLSDTELLVARRIRPQNDILLSSLSVEDGTLTKLVQLPRTRGAIFSPDKRYMAYLVRFHADSRNNGLWVLDLENLDVEPDPLPFFGAFRWRDEQHLVYIPFDPEADGLVFYEYDVQSGQTSRLFPNDGTTLELTIANNDWQVSPDGRKIALVAEKDKALDGIWVIDIAD